MIVGSHGKSDAILSPQHKLALDRLPAAIDLLIEAGRLEFHAAILGADQERPVFQFEAFGAAELEFSPGWVGPWGDLEVIFKMPLIAVKDEVDAGIDIVVADAAELRDTGSPLRRIVSGEVVAFTGERFHATQMCR